MDQDDLKKAETALVGAIVAVRQARNAAAHEAAGIPFREKPRVLADEAQAAMEALRRIVPDGRMALVADRAGLLGQLVEDARKLLEPLEWLDDRGRECAWCQATRLVILKTEDIGTPRERKPRDNHRPNCRWLQFIRAAQAVQAGPVQ